MDNLKIYNAVREVPTTAQKKITGGRLNGKTDINPMWRIKKLTEQFGAVGFGWRYEIVEKRLEHGGDETAAFVDINLYVREGQEWSAPIPGTGGSMFVAKEKNGLYVSDECFKMALTDAISVACKALGVGANVYWEQDKSKYTGAEYTINPPPTTQQPNNNSTIQQQPQSITITESQAKCLFVISGGKADIVKSVIEKYGYSKTTDIRKGDYDKICEEVQKGAK